MQIRNATESDIPRIMELREEFGHSMLYQYFPELIERYLSRIIVAEEVWERIPTLPFGAPLEDTLEREVVGYYHYIVSGDPGFIEMLRCYRQLSRKLISRAAVFFPEELCVVMQGGCHRDAFEEIIKYLQGIYPEIWCWNSITNTDKPSSKIAGYKELGFTYSPDEVHTFYNVHKGDYSTYRLGKWKERS